MEKSVDEWFEQAIHGCKEILNAAERATNPTVCIGEGKVTVALLALESARQLMEDL